MNIYLTVLSWLFVEDGVNGSDISVLPLQRGDWGVGESQFDQSSSDSATAGVKESGFDDLGFVPIGVFVILREVSGNQRGPAGSESPRPKLGLVRESQVLGDTLLFAELELRPFRLPLLPFFASGVLGPCVTY